MPSIRIQRVAELIKREVGEAIRAGVPAGESSLISVNDVEVTGDLREATVYASVLGDAKQQQRGFRILLKHRHQIQSHVAHTVILKYTPKLRFVLDDSVVRGNRVLQIIAEIEQQPSAPPPEATPPARQDETAPQDH
jgi:ribosome-binding factor A